MKIPSLDKLRRLEADKLINIRAMDDLIICSYSQDAFWNNVWDDALMICRGLILRVDLPWPESEKVTEVVALPLLKFFNVGDGGRFPNGKIVNVTEKLDGFAGVLYRHDGKLKVSTRHRFTSDSALWATDFLNSGRYNLKNIPSNYTLFFEIIYPESKIVIDYKGREDLVLLACRDRFSGRDFSDAFVAKLGKELGFSTPKVFPEIADVETALRLAKELDGNAEGWVLRMDDGSRWKVKGQAYRYLHKIISRITKKNVLESLMNGTIDQWMKQVPEEYLDEVTEWRKEYEAIARRKLIEVTSLMVDYPTTSRKEFAQWVTTNHKENALYLFLLYKGEDVMPYIWKQIWENRNVT